MKIFLFILLLSSLFFSCSKKMRKPDVLPEKKMREVMCDMMRADQYVADFLSKDSTRNKKDESVKLYDEIFYIHKITRGQFKSSLDYYSSQPDLFRAIIDSLAKRKAELTPPATDTHKIPDTMQKPFFRKRPQKQ
jgi:hypothetical protein